MKHTFVTLIFITASVFSFAQQALHQVIVLNEGRYNYLTSTIDVPVTIGTYNPQTTVYTTFDTIKNARFANDVSIDGNYIYAAADNQLVKYDLNTLQRVNSQTVPGIRKLSFANNLLYVTRGEYGVKYKSYFQVYDKNTLQLSYELDTLTGPKYASEAILIKDGIAYMAINNFGSGNIGLIGKVNISTKQYLPEVNLGADGINPENLVTQGQKVYSVNNKDFTSSSISEYDVQQDTRVTNNIYSSGSCNGSALLNNSIAFQASSDNFLGRYSLTTSSIKDTLHINKYIYQIAADTVGKNIYVSETDYKTYGTVFVYDQQGTPITLFSAGVTPGYFAFDVSSTSGVQTVEQNSSEVMVFPTLVKDQLTVVTKGMENQNTVVTVTDCLGRILFTQSGLNRNMNISRVDLSQQASGMYFVNVKSGNKNYSEKVVKM